MRKYIFLSFEWFTQEPNWNEVENIQMLWITKWLNATDAFENLKNENDWLKESSFSEIYCHELLDDNYQYFYLR